MHHRPVRFVLGPIQDYCLAERLPPLTIVVINQRGRPGSGFIALDPDRFDEGREEVYSYDWNTHPNPFGFASDGTQYKSLLDQLLARPEETEDIYRRVRFVARGR
jgi:putative restriction endonuclease